MNKVRLFALLISSLFPAVAQAQAPPEGAASRINVDRVLEVADQHLRKGEACIQEGNKDCARRQFDLAIDSMLEMGVDIRSDERLRAAYRELVEKISRYETAPAQMNQIGILKTQDFEGRPEKLAPVVAGVVGDYLFDGPLTTDEFQRRFGELRISFRDKYGRDITLTGADHGEHRRLYGRGSAYDIRVRDLTREQVRFIIATGQKLGLRIKDFSTWDKVATHNTRSLLLGRPLDTYATGVHLHIDRMALPRKSRATTTPAVSSKLRKAEKSNTN
jgi:hypothetical protein